MTESCDSRFSVIVEGFADVCVLRPYAMANLSISDGKRWGCAKALKRKSDVQDMRLRQESPGSCEEREAGSAFNRMWREAIKEEDLVIALEQFDYGQSCEAGAPDAAGSHLSVGVRTAGSLIRRAHTPPKARCGINQL